MLKARLLRVAERFWEPARHLARQFPRDLESAIAWSVPLFVVRLPHLWVHDLENYLRQRRLPASIGVADRPLHGCVIAICGKGFIVVDGSDGARELRFTMAHEVAHFLLDYQEPRQRAIERLGPQIEKVLDGQRPPTPAERVDGLLANAPVGLYAHFMHRIDGNVAASDVLEAESQADLLAFELLAPEAEVWDAVPNGFSQRTFTARKSSMQRLLVRRFGLPSQAAQKYSGMLCRSRFGGPSVREWLGIS
ncbi:MAG: hypothetical protein L0Z53_24000 [Acidobacteriales bacterium]|nr:hypothetical protein [Terriglobales bacterium]